MSTDAVEMVTIPRAELEALKAELRRLRRVEVDAEVRRRLKEFADAGGPAAVTGPEFTDEEIKAGKLAQALGLRG
jgi:hypothetical protein